MPLFHRGETAQQQPHRSASQRSLKKKVQCVPSEEGKLWSTFESIASRCRTRLMMLREGAILSHCITVVSLCLDTILENDFRYHATSTLLL